ncbi:MAG TPA: hypothetical protein VGL65_10140 [Gemmatimonadales bacterium]|jgi:hypothetical protein
MSDAAQRKDLNRVTHEVAARLSGRGVHLRGDETPNEISAIEDAVERFEEAVDSHGGDLMMDEPPLAPIRGLVLGQQETPPFHPAPSLRILVALQIQNGR